MSRDQCIEQSVTSIQSLLNTNGPSFLMTSHVRLALWTLPSSLVKKNLPLKTLSNTGLDFWSKLIACLVLHQHMYKSKLPSFFGKRTLYFYQKGKLWNFGVSK